MNPFYFIKTKLIQNRVLFLNDEINSEVTSELIPTLFYLDSENQDEDITIYINSEGGYIDSLYAIYDTFLNIKSPIRTIALGKAYSAAAVILAAGTKGKRYVSPNTEVMIHHVQVSEVEGSAHEVAKQIERYNSENKNLLKILSKHTGKTYSKINKDCKEDFYLSAKDAVKYGIADYVYIPKKTFSK